METLTAPRTAVDAYRGVLQSAETIRNDEPATISVMSAGDCLRQGDIYVIALDIAPRSTGPAPSRQLVQGTTQGSRHIAEGDCDVYLPDQDEAMKILNRLIPATRGQELFIGPAIHAREPVTITHVEHGHRTLPPGEYLTVGQRTWAGEIRRTLD